jgi:hypothetical protein
MLDAHVAAAFVVGEPFASDEPYGKNTYSSTTQQ